MARQINDKKKVLLARKEEILKDLKYFEKRLEEARSHKTSTSYIDDEDDSDSEIFSLDMGPSVPDLKLEQGRLQTCLHATQELTNLCVLQSEVNVMVNDPVYEREPPVTEQGTWREVTADCRVDLVPFSITFFTHQPNRIFGPISYRGLRVLPVKAAHENELSKSILPRVDKPSDAVEVLRSYAVAHRSRRTTLARLAEKYSNSLFMEPMAEGGYIMKCANLLEVSWTLENKWSPLAAFHHRMKFDLEYMDEVYVKIISQAHRELSDPTLETDERTRLMSKIIATCLEAQGHTQELYESMESDIESEKLRKRRTTLDEEIEEPVNKKKKASEIMAPPKSLPKKTKPKGKENSNDNKKDPKIVNRSGTDDCNNGPKKAKLNHESLTMNSNMNTKNKVDNEAAVLKKLGDNNAGDMRDNITRKINVDKEVMEKISGKEKGVVKTKKKDNVTKNIDSTSKHSSDNKNIDSLIKGPDTNAGIVKRNIGSSKLDHAKNVEVCTNNRTNKIKEVEDNIARKINVDNQNLKGKSINSKNTVDTKNTNKPGNTKNSNKSLDNLTKQDTAKDSNIIVKDKNSKLNNFPKNVKSLNARGTTKVQNIEGGSQIIEKPRINKVGSNQKSMASKDDNLNRLVEVSDSKNILKTKSTSNVKENVASINKKVNKEIAFKAKSVEKSKTVDIVVANTINNSYEEDIKTNSNDKNMKSKSFKSSKKEKRTEDDISRNSNKQMPKKENIKHVSTQNFATSTLNHKNAKSSVNVEKNVDKSNYTLTKVNQDTQLKLVTKNINAKSKNTDNIIDKIDKNNVMEKETVSNLKRIVNKNVTVNKNTLTDFNKRHFLKSNENSESKLLQQKTNDNNFDANDKLKTNLKEKHNFPDVIKKITKTKTHKPSKSPIQKNKIKLLNPRNKISMDKLKMTKQGENNLQKNTSGNNKMFTKIPQKLMSVREQIVKKNQLRISPKKINSNFKTDSQNSSRSSLRSLQKCVTGIPRLMKKPIRK